MSRDLQLALLVIALGADLVFVAAEFLFWLKAKPTPAVIEKVVTTIQRSDSELGPPGERVDTGFKVTVRMGADDAPRRSAVMAVNGDVPVAVGQGVTVMALDPKPAWIFWSDMVRPGGIGRPIFRLTLGLALLVALGVSGWPIFKAALSR